MFWIIIWIDFSQIKKYEYNAQNQIVSIKEGESFDGIFILIKIFLRKWQVGKTI